MAWRNLIFDFDGVILDSNAIRFDGFRHIYAGEAGLERFMEYVTANPGLSRYDKIRHYYREIKGTKAEDDAVAQDAQRYADWVRPRVEVAPFIPGAVACLDSCAGSFLMGLVSASDGCELAGICRKRSLDRYFVRIMGSPVPKTDNIICLVAAQGWRLQETVYVGDTLNDQQAARDAGVDFVGFGDTFAGLSGVVAVADHEGLRKLLFERGEKH